MQPPTDEQVRAAWDAIAVATGPGGTALNAGSGDHYVDGWVNLDIDSEIKADVHADLCAIPLPDASCGRILCSHVLEHIDYREQVPRVLAEFRRVLAPGGQLCILGPDIDRAVLLGETPEVLKRIVAWTKEFYAEEWKYVVPPHGHAWTSTQLLTELALDAAGYTWDNYSGRLHRLPVAGWPIGNTAPFQLGYVCQ